MNIQEIFQDFDNNFITKKGELIYSNPEVFKIFIQDVVIPSVLKEVLPEENELINKEHGGKTRLAQESVIHSIKQKAKERFGIEL